ncbi:HAD family phosphatase [Granulicella sp. S156]|uniref:HAD family hydrolase n=1 Tax=Granulicella sp. S156 TaxID=1747224 RepID=UPI0020B166CA|nr:haloacid dehalogenase-like hydrolase [Granulicella sp. S156]
MNTLSSSPIPVAAPAVLSTEQFSTRVHALSPRIAVFDCDGTLWSGDAGSSFMRWTMDTGLLSREATDWLNSRYAEYKRGTVSELAICGEMVQIYHGLRESELRRAAATFFRDHIERNIFPEMLELVTALQRDGVEIWAVSSTCDWVIEEGVQRFNIPANRVLAARVAIDNGRASERLLDVPTDEGKVASLKLAGITAPDAVFGNSVHDAAMLAIARGAFPVNPSGELVQRSVEEKWPVYYPASVAPSRQ